MPRAGWSQAADVPPRLPSFAELEAAGAIIGRIVIVNQNIFDTLDPKEDKLLFRWANTLHLQTRPGVIEDRLLFKSGDRLSVSRIDETERVLRRARYLYDVQFRPIAWQDGVVDIEVATRDTWTLDPGITLGRSGGQNSSGFSLHEYNLLGSGVALSLGRTNNVDRTSNEVQLSTEHAFGGWTWLSLSLADNSDGKRQAFTVERPFYALDTRWAAGVSASRDDRLEAVYNGGEVVSRYRQGQDRAEAYGGWSAGRVDGWVQRWSLGMNLSDDSHSLEPGEVAPAELPADERLVGPFVRYQLIEDRFEKARNRNQIERAEFFTLGTNATVQLGRALTSLGSSRDAWLYSGSFSRGFTLAPEHTLTTAAAISGRLADGQVQRQQIGANAAYFLRQNKRWLFYASASGDVLTNPAPTDELLLGGDNGLRGYPLRYQSGTQRALMTVEERLYTDVFVYRLIRLGAAAYVDVGRAWGGDNINTANPGWLANVGAGLRFFSVRAAFSSVLHVDVAVPVVRAPDLSRVQLLLKSKASF